MLLYFNGDELIILNSMNLMNICQFGKFNEMYLYKNIKVSISINMFRDTVSIVRR